MESTQVLLLPGWQSSGPQHWQSLWRQQLGYTWVEQADWMRPRRGDWMARLDEVVLSTRGPLALVAHSLGCQLVAAWAAHSRHTSRVRAALLVAPGDVAQPELRAVLPSWVPPVLQPLPFRSQVVASSNDPYCRFERASAFAQAWGSTLVSLGPCGHINADSGVGDWPEGRQLLQALLSESEGDA
jgi:hypothetical protein